MTATYWGPFAALATDAGARVEELEPFSGLAAELYDELSIKDWDEAQYLALAARSAGPILELGCGTGRISLRLAEAGHELLGLDRSEAMLAVLRARLQVAAPEVRRRVRLVCADATDFELGERFALILLPYLTLGLIAGRDAQLAVLRAAARHLADDGVFAFDFLTVVDGDAAELGGEVLERTFSLHGQAVHARFGTRYLADQRALSVNTWFGLGGHEARGYLMALREEVFEPGEIEELLERAGLVVARRHGELAAGTATRRTLIECRRRAHHAHPLWQPYHPMAGVGVPPLTLVAGEGCEVRDDAGRRYLDASGGLWSVQCGLGRAEIVQAVTRQLERLSYATLFLGRASDTALELARQLVELAPAPLEWVYLTGSGSESTELAMKLARSACALRGQAHKQGILYLDASYHGTFFGSVGVSGLVPERAVFDPQLPGLGSVPTPLPENCPPGVTFEDYALGFAAKLETMLEHAGHRVAALLLEPVLGAAGVVALPASYLRRVARACRRHQVLLVVDEVATGFGRTGRWFASEHAELRPDVMLLGKGINSGYLPLGAVLFSAELGEQLGAAGHALVHGSTHNGNPAACAAALATFEVLRRDGLIERSARLGEWLLARLGELAGRPGLGPVRGRGLFTFVGLREEGGQPASERAVLGVLRALQERGVLVYPTRGGVMLAPALTITERELEQVVRALEAVLAAHRLVDGEAARR